MNTQLFLRQQGTALVTAMLIVALASVAATSMLKQQHIDIRRAENMVRGDQLSLYVQAGENWARSVLTRDKFENEYDSLAENWAKLDEPLPLNDGRIQVKVEDLQGRFNLNNLLDEEGRLSKPDLQQFRNLLAVLELDVELATAILDWIDADVNPGLPSGAEDQEYLKLDVPYRTANAPFVSSSELLLIRGMTREDFDKLEPFVTALPERGEVNVNTTTASVLAAMIEGMTLDEASTLIEGRPEKGYEDIARFRGEQALNGSEVQGIGVSSRYFLVQVNVEQGRYNAARQSILARGEGDELGGFIQRSRTGL